jgi:DNA-binding transcriptional MerR regulator
MMNLLMVGAARAVGSSFSLTVGKYRFEEQQILLLIITGLFIIAALGAAHSFIYGGQSYQRRHNDRGTTKSRHAGPHVSAPPRPWVRNSSPTPIGSGGSRSFFDRMLDRMRFLRKKKELDSSIEEIERARDQQTQSSAKRDQGVYSRQSIGGQDVWSQHSERSASRTSPNSRGRGQWDSHRVARHSVDWEQEHTRAEGTGVPIGHDSSNPNASSSVSGESSATREVQKKNVWRQVPSTLNRDLVKEDQPDIDALSSTNSGQTFGTARPPVDEAAKVVEAWRRVWDSEILSLQVLERRLREVPGVLNVSVLPDSSVVVLHFRDRHLAVPSQRDFELCEDMFEPDQKPGRFAAVRDLTKPAETEQDGTLRSMGTVSIEHG